MIQCLADQSIDNIEAVWSGRPKKIASVERPALGDPPLSQTARHDT
jgi:hypothetical protein